MTELRFHQDLYPATAVDEAVGVYNRFASFELAEDAAHRIVRVSASSPARERHISLELANYALGLTIQGRKGS